MQLICSQYLEEIELKCYNKCSDLHILGNVQRKWRKTEEEMLNPLV